MALKINSNVIVIDQLKARMQTIEAETRGDCLLICSPIRFGLDVAVREILDDIRPKKRKITVILETNGGFIEVAQRIAQTLRNGYRVVDFLIPNCAYSAGTVLAMSGDDIWMDYFSVLGPIDPQIEKDDKMVPALGYLEQYNRLIEKSKSGKLSTAELAFLINRFDPAELYMYEQAREMSISLLKEWLVKYKFKNWKQTKTRRIKVDKAMRIKRAEEIAKALNKIDKWNSHGRGIHMSVVRRNLQLLIRDFEAIPKLNTAIRDYHRLLQDYLSTVRHSWVVQTRQHYIPLG